MIKTITLQITEEEELTMIDSLESYHKSLIHQIDNAYSTTVYNKLTEEINKVVGMLNILKGDR